MSIRFRKSMILLLTLLMLASALPGLAVPGAALEKNRTVRVGFFAYPGYHELEDNVRSGYGYDFLMLLQRYTRLNYEFVGYEKSWEEMQRMLRDGEIDLLTSARKTGEREKIYDFSESIGTNRAQLSVRADDDRFIPGAYADLDGIVVGELTGNSRNADMAAFAAEKGFRYTVREYSDAEQLRQALEDREVDAVAASSLRKTAGEKIIAEFAAEDFYCIVRKGDGELLNEINYGISQMDLYEGNWRENLHYKNYKSGGEAALAFSARERAYIRAVQNGEKSITVSAQPDINPYSFTENGSLTGIIPDYFAHLMEMAGLPYTTLAAKDGDEFQTWIMTNRTDVIMDCRYGSSPSADADFGLVTEPYMELTTSRVTRKGFGGTVRSVAAVDSRETDYIDADIAEDAAYLTVGTREEAMQAVKDGRADACYVYTYMAEKFINDDPDGSLQTVVLAGPVYQEYIYVGPKTDHELCSILNKCIKADASGVLDAYIRKYTTAAYDSLTLRQYLRLHPGLTLTGSLLLAALIVLAVVLFFRAGAERMRNRQLELELERSRGAKRDRDIIEILASEYTAVYYVEPAADGFTPYTMNESVESTFGRIFRSGIRFSEAYEMYVSKRVAPEDKEMMRRVGSVGHIMEELREKKSFAVTYRDFLGRWSELKVVKVDGEKEEPTAVALGFADKDAELRTELERKAAAARDAAVIAGLSDDFGCVVYVNFETGEEVHYRFDPLLTAGVPGWETISNFHERMEVLQERLVHPDDRKDFLPRGAARETILECLKKEGVYYHNFRIVIGGETKYYQLKMVRDENAESYVIAGFRNVDSSVRREMEYQEKLEAANRSKTDFLFNMSHDIRTPMNAIIGFTQLAVKHIDDRPRVLDSLRKIEASGNHLLELINEVLDMSRVEAGKLRSETKTVDVEDAAAHMVAICRESAEQRSIRLSFRSENIVHRMVEADELHINQIILNILGNAIKYTEPGGSVLYTVEEIDSKRSGCGCYVFTVEDTGIGMSPEFLERIYESFSREENASTSSVQGTGLGMTIVRRLVDYLGGRIDIRSEQGIGTRVTVTLELRFSDDRPGAQAPEESVLPDLNGKKVLLVEDNELNREIATDILEESGLAVEAAENGIVAVQRVRSRGTAYYDFVLMDIQMPLMDGYEAAAEIRKLPGAEKLPIIALSANAFEEDRRKSLEAGMNDHVAKPIVIPELLKALGRFTGT